MNTSDIKPRYEVLSKSVDAMDIDDLSPSVALLHAIKSTPGHKADEADYCYRLIHRVYSDLKEASRLQTLHPVQDCILGDFHRASYIEGTIQSAKTALANLILQINNLTASSDRSSNPLVQFRQALRRQEPILSPQIQSELHICHFSLLQSINRMQTWVDAADKEAIGKVRASLVVNDSAFGDVEEMLRSPYARRRNRQQRWSSMNEYKSMSIPSFDVGWAANSDALVSQASLISLVPAPDATRTDQYSYDEKPLSGSVALPHELDVNISLPQSARFADKLSLSESSVQEKVPAHLELASQRDSELKEPSTQTHSNEQIPKLPGNTGDLVATSQVEELWFESPSIGTSHITTPSSAARAVHPGALCEPERSPVSFISHLASSFDADAIQSRRLAEGQMTRNGQFASAQLVNCTMPHVNAPNASRQDLNHAYVPRAYGAVEMDSNASLRLSVSTADNGAITGASPLRLRSSVSYELTNWSDAPIAIDQTPSSKNRDDKDWIAPPGLSADENLPEVYTPRTRNAAHDQAFPSQVNYAATPGATSMPADILRRKNSRRARKARRALLDDG